VPGAMLSIFGEILRGPSQNGGEQYAVLRYPLGDSFLTPENLTPRNLPQALVQYFQEVSGLFLGL
jgi:hypothetical protein